MWRSMRDLRDGRGQGVGAGRGVWDSHGLPGRSTLVEQLQRGGDPATAGLRRMAPTDQLAEGASAPGARQSVGDGNDEARPPRIAQDANAEELPGEHDLGDPHAEHEPPGDDHEDAAEAQDGDGATGQASESVLDPDTADPQGDGMDMHVANEIDEEEKQETDEDEDELARDDVAEQALASEQAACDENDAPTSDARALDGDDATDDVGHGSREPGGDMLDTSPSDRERATAAILPPPIDPVIKKPDPKKRKRSFDSLLGGRGWKKIGLAGVRRKDIGTKITILAIDRHNRHVSLDTSRGGKKPRRFSLPEQAKAQGAEIALNGDLFKFENGKPSGLHRRNGKNLSGSKRSPESGMFAFQRRGRAAILPGNRRPPRWAKNVVSGRPVILRNGKVKSYDQMLTHYQKAPKEERVIERSRLKSNELGRSAVGLSRSGRILFLAAATESSTRHMAKVLKRQGVDDALALDGSGSAQMFIKGAKGNDLVKKGDDREIANAIFVNTRS
jgi:hypothetical protein